MASRRLFINGRFLAQRITGVQRFAIETLGAIDALLAEGTMPPLALEVLAPKNARDPDLRRIAFRRIGPLTGHAWEQATLPAAVGRLPLLSFGPTGPLSKREQVVTIHDAAVRAVPETYSRSFRIWYEVVLRTMLARTPRVMTVSEFSKSELVTRFGARAERIRVSGEGWEHVRRVPADPSILSRNGIVPKRYVLAVSSITPSKNFGVVARALERMSGVTEFQAVIAGAVDSRLFGTTVLHPTRGHKYLGYVSDGELRALYENAGVFVFPSRYEGFGLPPLEAMACGCPVIASNVAAMPEVCGDGAAYFNPGDDDELATLVQRVMSDPDFRDGLISRGARQLDRHRWRNAATSYLAMIREWTEPSPTGRC